MFTELEGVRCSPAQRRMTALGEMILRERGAVELEGAIKQLGHEKSEGAKSISGTGHL
jgi:hypothetical protein